MKKFEKAELEVVEFNAQDVITTSVCEGVDSFCSADYSPINPQPEGLSCFD